MHNVVGLCAPSPGRAPRGLLLRAQHHWGVGGCPPPPPHPTPGRTAREHRRQHRDSRLAKPGQLAENDGWNCLWRGHPVQPTDHLMPPPPPPPTPPHPLKVGTAEHCSICMPGHACVERFVTCMRPPPPPVLKRLGQIFFWAFGQSKNFLRPVWRQLVETKNFLRRLQKFPHHWHNAGHVLLPGSAANGFRL